MRLSNSLPGSDLYLERKSAYPRYSGVDGINWYDLPLRPVLPELFVRYRRLVVFLPVGAAVRLLAPALVDKRRDAAVVCVDDGGRYAVSLLSGHHGGADQLAREVADAIGAQPVITSASDALDVTAVDMVGRNLGWKIDASADDLTRAAAAVVNGGPVALWLDPETGAPWPDSEPLSDGMFVVDRPAETGDPAFKAVLVVSDRANPLAERTKDNERPLVIYRPPTLMAGVGCRRGVGAQHLRELLESTLAGHNLSHECLAGIATADIKAEEAGIIALAAELDVPLHSFTAAELNSVAARQPVASMAGGTVSGPTPSAAQDLLGIFGVSEPAAMLAAGADGLAVSRTKSDRATVAVARIFNPASSTPIAMKGSQ